MSFVMDGSLGVSLVQSSALQNIYPIGSIFISAISTNPSVLLGFGIWEPFATGRTIIGAGTSDKLFTAGEIGGESNNTLTTNQIPTHRHSLSALNVNNTAAFSINDDGGDNLVNSDNAIPGVNGTKMIDMGTRIMGDVGGGLSHNNLQPYIVTYIWRRMS